MHRREFCALALLAAAAVPAHAAQPTPVTLYKRPACACCEGYAQYLDQNGFKTTVHETPDLDAMSLNAGFPKALEGCHMSLIAGYVVEGHVPAPMIRRLLAGRPAIVGITLPGMPTGVPGMDGPKPHPLTVYAVARDGTQTVFDVI